MKIQAVIGLAAFGLFFAGNCSGVELVRDGKPCAKIVITTNACRMVQYAAEELQSYIEKISGAKLPIEKEPLTGEVSLNQAENYIFVGESPYTRKLGMDVSQLPPDGFKIVATNNWLALIGRDYKGEPITTALGSMFTLGSTYDKETGISSLGESGTLYGVYRFLENYLGVRWFMPGELGEVAPKQNSISIDKINYQEAPDTAFRRLMFAYSFSDKDMVRWYRRAGFGGNMPVYIQHSFPCFVDRHLKTHPEYFLDQGKAKYKFLALKDPAVLKQFAEDIREYFNAHPQETFYPVMPDDMNLDACPEEQKRDERFHDIADPSMGKEGAYSDYVWNFVNNVAKEVAKTHPDKIVSCCAYSDYRVPPKTIKELNPNVAVMICKTRNGNANAENKKRVNDFIKEWAKKSKHIYAWEYYNWYYCGGVLPGTPVIFPHLIADDFKFLKGISSGEFIEAETLNPPIHKVANHGMTHLNYYVTAKYMWDADRDLEALLDDYYEKFYGPAMDEMRKFFTRAEAIWDKFVGKAAIDRYYVPGAFECSQEEIEELLGYLKNAKEKAGDTLYGKRVDFILAEASKMVKTGIVSTRTSVAVPLSDQKEPGLVAYWKFNEGEGKLVKDASGNGNDAVAYNTVWLKDKKGASLEFNGTNSAVEVRYPKNLSPKRTLTMMGWFYIMPDQADKNIGLIWTHNYAYALSFNSDFVSFWAYGETGGRYTTRYMRGHLTAPGWNHLAGVYNVDAPMNQEKKEKECIKAYLNGEVMAVLPYAAPIRYTGDGKPWKKFDDFLIHIGAANYGTEYQSSFKGRIDEVKIYDRALSDAEVKAEFEKGKRALSPADI